MTIIDFKTRAPVETVQPRKRIRAHNEDQIQRALVRHLQLRARAGVVWLHVPNGGYRNAVEAARFKGLGVKAGVPDLLFFYQSKLFALELKAEKGRITEAQAQMMHDIA